MIIKILWPSEKRAFGETESRWKTLGKIKLKTIHTETRKVTQERKDCKL